MKGVPIEKKYYIQPNNKRPIIYPIELLCLSTSYKNVMLEYKNIGAINVQTVLLSHIKRKNKLYVP